jgi:hypothetical protein
MAATRPRLLGHIVLRQIDTLPVSLHQHPGTSQALPIGKTYLFQQMHIRQLAEIPCARPLLLLPRRLDRRLFRRLARVDFVSDWGEDVG